jgi:CheY-like chemotaxis protein
MLHKWAFARIRCYRQKMNAEPTFLVAEDNENDILLLRHAFKKAGLTIPLTFARDGQEAMDSLRELQVSGSFPICFFLTCKCPNTAVLKCFTG